MNIAASIRDILVTDVFVEVPVDEMHDDDSLRDVYGLDSLGFVELRVQCEKRFGVTITTDDFTPENFATVGDLTALVDRLRQDTVAAGAQPR